MPFGTFEPGLPLLAHKPSDLKLRCYNSVQGSADHTARLTAAKELYEWCNGESRPINRGATLGGKTVSTPITHVRPKSHRFTNAVTSFGFTTLEELSRLTELEFLSARNCGAGTLNEAREILAKHGLSFSLTRNRKGDEVGV